MTKARTVGRIESRTGRKYVLVDDQGGRFLAESDTIRSVGSRVLVVAGVIVSLAGARSTAKVYRV